MSKDAVRVRATITDGSSIVTERTAEWQNNIESIMTTGSSCQSVTVRLENTTVIHSRHPVIIISAHIIISHTWSWVCAALLTHASTATHSLTKTQKKKQYETNYTKSVIKKILTFQLIGPFAQQSSYGVALRKSRSARPHLLTFLICNWQAFYKITILLLRLSPPSLSDLKHKL